MKDNTQIETLDKAAERYILSEGGETQRMFGHHYRSFKAGAEWQKEQDEKTIDRLYKTIFDLQKQLSELDRILK